MAPGPQPETLPISDEIQMERNAGLIMGTNNSSIVSKRSVERLYLPEPHFYRYFVRKPQRRSPTINRGYWLRMRAVDWVVRHFLEKASSRPKIVINLGCGYDPLPFQWLATEPDLCEDTKFIDVDYEELMITKKEVIRSTAKLADLLTSVQGNTEEKSVLIDSAHYAAIGCDLRNTKRLQRLLKMICDVDNCLVLCVAEVSITYMHTDAADALIAFTSKLSDDVTFCLLEQGSPDRPDHPFTATMVKHFQKLGTPLHSLFDYPGQHSQIVRFQRAGYSHCEVQNLWELWSNPRFLSISQRLALDHVEPFDEWEEFALFASHYLLVVADNRPGHEVPEIPRSRRDSITSIASDISARTASPFKLDKQWFAFKYSEPQSEETKRHHASSYQLFDQDAVAMHGGVGPKARLSSTVVCRDHHNHEDTPIVPPPEISARCCHTITSLTNGQNLLVGGRGSPKQPMKDCWMQTRAQWSQVDDLPIARYRHRTVPVTLPDGHFGAVVFGGKTGPSQVAVDTLLWHPQTGWQTLLYLHQTPMPRFGATFVHLGFNHGLLFGGMRQDGLICQGLWRWRLIIRDNKVAGISFRTSNALDASIGAYPWFARFGASYGLVRDELLIIGGIAKSGCVPKVYEILSVLGSFSAFNEYEKEMQLRLTCVEPTMPVGCPRPFFIGHSTHRTKTGTLVLMGGGATCFSFGNYYNSGIWIMHERETGLHLNWTVAQNQTTKASNHRQSVGIHTDTSVSKVKEVPPVKISQPVEFLNLVQASQPAVLQDLDLGPCLSIWKPTYLREKIAPDKTVVIHSSSSASMNFQRKNFAYKTLPFPSFIAALNSPSSHIYLRALSASDPTTMPADFDHDWPELASDVTIPTFLHAVLQKAKHSSCLRIANNTTMWLHYDVMANVLLQIHGRKKLILFPPADIERLSFPPGSTTSEVDIFRHSDPGSGTRKDTTDDSSIDQEPSREGVDHKASSKGAEPKIVVPSGTNPFVVILNPGDALLIPPLWAHTGISLEHDGITKPSAPVHGDQTHTPARIPQDTPSQVTTAPNFVGSATETTTSAADTTQLPADTATSVPSLLSASSPDTAQPESNMTDLFSSWSPAPTQQSAPQSPLPSAPTNKYTNIALNIFFRSLPRQSYTVGRDIYANRDLAAYEDSRRDLDRIVKRFVKIGENDNPGNNNKHQANTGDRDNHNHKDGDDGDDGNDGNNDTGNIDIDLDRGINTSIPRDVIKAYLKRLADELTKKANDL